jgi:DedD protein
MDPQLKQRMVGALVLVAAAVLIVPLWLDGGYRDPRTQQRDMAPMPADQFPPNVPSVPAETITEIDAGLDASSASLATTALANVVPPPVLPDAPAVPVHVPRVPPPAAPPTAPSPQTPPPPPATVDVLETSLRWAVQLGSFSSRDNAELLLRRLQAAGTAGRIVAVKESYGMTFRVRAGPLEERAEALKLREKLARSMELRGILVRE